MLRGMDAPLTKSSQHYPVDSILGLYAVFKLTAAILHLNA